jgi:hypothetical protein
VADLYLDQNIPRRVALLLVANGRTVHTARQLGLHKASDHQHLLIAAQRGWILVTRDKDFLLLHRAWQDWALAWGVAPIPEHRGILVVSDHWHLQRLADEVDALLTRLGGAPSVNTLYEWQDPAGWQLR